MKYMLKRIFIGVAIGTILFLIKGGNVFAATSSKYLYNFNTKVATMSFDICDHNDYNSLCINGFNKTVTLTSNSDYKVLYSNSDKVIGLKTFGVSLVSNSSDQLIYRYGQLTSNINLFFNNNQNSGADTNRLRTNEFLSYVKIITQDNIECISTNLGASLGTASTGGYNLYPTFEVPTECRGKYLKELDILWQSGYNYTGSSNIFNPIDYQSGDNQTTFLSKNRNNTYLLSWGITQKEINHNVTISQNLNNVMVYFNSNSVGYGSSLITNTYTEEEQQINENLAQLEKEKYFASLGGTNLGPEFPNSDQFSEISDGYEELDSDIQQKLNNVYFNDFLTALTQKPIYELMWIVRSDNVGGTNNQTIACPTIYMPFKRDHTTGLDIFGMNLPCMSDLYSQIPYVGESGAGNTITIIGIYQLVITGWLTYLLILTWLNLIKYTITKSSSEIEVLEL